MSDKETKLILKLILRVLMQILACFPHLLTNPYLYGSVLDDLKNSHEACKKALKCIDDSKEA